MRLETGATDPRDYNRTRTKENRELWSNMGYRSASALVHDDDRDLVLRYLEVWRFQRLQELINSGAEDNLLHKVGTRNMYKYPGKSAITDLKSRALNSEAANDVGRLLERSEAYKRSYSAIKGGYKAEAPYSTRVLAEARALVAMNLAVAYYKLALAMVDHAAPLTVFGLNLQADNG